MVIVSGNSTVCNEVQSEKVSAAILVIELGIRILFRLELKKALNSISATPSGISNFLMKSI